MSPDDPGAKPHYHGVRFYEDDVALCRIVADFIGDGLAAGQPAVVIATRPHVDIIGGELKALSFDMKRLQEMSRLERICAEHSHVVCAAGQPTRIGVA